MQKLEFILENETNKILWDFDVEKDDQIPARRPDLVLIKKKKRTCHIVDFAVLADHREMKAKRYKLTWILPESWKVLLISIVVIAPGMDPKSLEKRMKKFEIKNKIETPDHSRIEIV